MKKTLWLFLAVVFATNMTSCSDDDNGNSTRVNLIGKWEFVETGTEIEGSEVLFPYSNSCESAKDFVEIFHNDTLMVTLHNEECEESYINNEWELNGNTVIIDSGEEAEILALDSTTLKTRGINAEGSPVIIVFKRI